MAVYRHYHSFSLGMRFSEYIQYNKSRSATMVKKNWYRQYVRNIGSLFPNVSLAKYDPTIDYQSIVEWTDRKMKRTTKLVYPPNEARHHDTIVWSNNAFTAIGSQRNSLSVNGTVFEHSLAILDVPPNWWRSVYNIRRKDADAWEYTVSNLYSFLDELTRNISCDVLTFNDINDKTHTFVCITSYFHFHYFKHHIVLCCAIIESEDDTWWQEYSTFMPIHTSYMTSTTTETLKNYFISQIKYAHVFACVTDVKCPSYYDPLEGEMKSFIPFGTFRDMLDIQSFDSTLFIVPHVDDTRCYNISGLSNMSMFLPDFKVVVYYNPVYFSISDVERFLVLNDILYRIELTDSTNVLFSKEEKSFIRHSSCSTIDPSQNTIKRLSQIMYKNPTYYSSLLEMYSS